jgi:hypothetical protein
MGAGRFVCVALPFGLTLVSMICILISMLAGVTNKNLDMFEIKTQNLSISSNSLENLASEIFKRVTPITLLTTTALNGQTSASSVLSGNNITAADLGLADNYKVSLWNYCSQTGSTVNCTSAKFNWAASALNTTAIDAMLNANSAGVNVTLPEELTSSLKTFIVVSKWTQVVYIIAFVTCAIELFFGLFAICSRAGSCLTFLISGLSTTTIIAASILATVQSSVVTGSVDATAKAYGVKASINTSFLATTWLAVAFSIASGIFWMFTICCCAADHHKNNRRSRGGDQEKLIPTGAYQRVNDPAEYHSGYGQQQQGVYAHGAQQPEYGVPMHNVKPTRDNGHLEPYREGGL